MHDQPSTNQPARQSQRPEATPNRRHSITVAAIKATLSGVARAATEWLLAHLTS
jgi:hypothetical protein